MVMVVAVAVVMMMMIALDGFEDDDGCSCSCDRDSGCCGIRMMVAVMMVQHGEADRATVAVTVVGGGSGEPQCEIAAGPTKTEGPDPVREAAASWKP